MQVILDPPRLIIWALCTSFLCYFFLALNCFHDLLLQKTCTLHTIAFCKNIGSRNAIPSFQITVVLRKFRIRCRITVAKLIPLLTLEVDRFVNENKLAQLLTKSYFYLAFK